MKRTEKIYGTRPEDLGLIDLSPEEMMFWLYCPIRVPGMLHPFILPGNLVQYKPLVRAVMQDCSDQWEDSYVYITAKTLWVNSESPGNRPGWHSDGFLTDDLNYIWCDANPTTFFDDGKLHSFSADHNASLGEMDSLCEATDANQFTLPVKHLLKLDQRVLHKVTTNINPGVRTFVKISVSRHKYALRGNSINHELVLAWDYQERKAERNCPIGEK